MAKYILTFSTDRPAGSLGGATFQKSGTVFAIRKRNVPVQKKSPAQSTVKNRFDHVQKNWKNLSTLEKETFADEAPNYPRIDSLGNSYTLLANNLQGSSNLSLIAAEQPTINSMPSAPPFQDVEVGNIFVTESLSLAVFSIVQIVVPAGFTLMTYVTRALSEGTDSPPSNSYKLLNARPEGTNPALNQWDAYFMLFGRQNPPVNSKVWVRFTLVPNGTGQIMSETEGFGPFL